MAELKSTQDRYPWYDVDNGILRDRSIFTDQHIYQQ